MVLKMHSPFQLECTPYEDVDLLLLGFPIIADVRFVISVYQTGIYT